MITTMPDWLHDNEALVLWLGVASAVLFIGSLVLTPALLVRIPADYYAHERRPPSRWAAQRPSVRIFVLVLKNALGYVLVIAGVAMLALPGQGLLTIAAGLLLINLPGKYRFEKWLVRRRPVHRAINWLRRKRGREPLQVAD